MTFERAGSLAVRTASRLAVQTTIDWSPGRPFSGSTGLIRVKATRGAAAARRERYPYRSFGLGSATLLDAPHGASHVDDGFHNDLLNAWAKETIVHV